MPFDRSSRPVQANDNYHFKLRSSGISSDYYMQQMFLPKCSYAMLLERILKIAFLGTLPPFPFWEASEKVELGG